MAPVKRVEISSDRFVRMVSQLAQEKRRVPPMWSKKIRPIVQSSGSEEVRLVREKHKDKVKLALQCTYISAWRKLTKV